MVDLKTILFRFSGNNLIKLQMLNKKFRSKLRVSDLLKKTSTREDLFVWKNP